MDDAQQRKQMIDKFWKDDRAFAAYLTTVPEEWKGEADHLYQEGMALADIKESVASYQDATEYPLRLTSYELGIVANRLQYQPDVSPKERAILNKIYKVGEEVQTLNKARSAQKQSPAA